LAKTQPSRVSKGDRRQPARGLVEVAGLAHVLRRSQPAVQAVRPRVVRADQDAVGVGPRLVDELRSPVLAHVEEGAEAAVVAPDRHDRFVADRDGEEVAGLGRVLLLADAHPGALIQVPKLPGEDGLVRVCLRRKQRRLSRSPLNFRGGPST
jgi:hypothetical protein